MNNEPVAIRYDFDGYGYQYMDSGSGSDWQTRVIGEPLYTHPMRELSDEEILEIASPMFVDVRYPSTALEFAKDLIKKAREK